MAIDQFPAIHSIVKVIHSMMPEEQILSWTDEGIRRLQAAKSSPGSPLQLTHMVLGNASTPLPDIKQGTQVRNEVYRAPVDRVAVDTEKKCIVCELMMPENKREQEIREIGVFEHETLVALGYASSRYTPVQQGSMWTYIVHIPLSYIPVQEKDSGWSAYNIFNSTLEEIPASVIETVDNLINTNVSDTRYLNASENLREISNQATARENLGLGTPALAQTNLGLGTAALKNVGTNIDDLITTGAVENLFSAKADKAEVSKLIDYFNLIFGDIDGVSYLLRPGLTSDELEGWLTDVSNLKNFTVVDSTSAMNAVAASTTAMTAVADSTTAMTAVAASTTAMNALATSQAAMNVVAASQTAREVLRNSSTAIAAIGANSMAIAKFATGLATGLNPQSYADMTAVAASPEAMTPVAASTTAMTAVADSTTAMNALAASTTAMTAVADSTTAMTAVADSTTAMTAVAASTTAMTAVAASTTAMNALATSQAAMNVVAASQTAREVLRNSSTAIAAIGANSMAIAKFATGLATGLNPQSYADMTAVAASPEAMTPVAASTTAMTAVADSTTAMNALAASTTAMTAVAASTTAMTAVADSTTAMNAVAASTTAMNAVVNSGLALNAIVKSELACKKIETSIQIYRNQLQNTLNVTQSDLFEKQLGKIVFSSDKPDGFGTKTIYIPIEENSSCSGHPGNTVYSYHNTLILHSSHYSGVVGVSVGIALRGVKVSMTNFNYNGSNHFNDYYVKFDVYTAV